MKTGVFMLIDTCGAAAAKATESARMFVKRRERIVFVIVVEVLVVAQV